MVTASPSAAGMQIIPENAKLLHTKRVGRTFQKAARLTEIGHQKSTKMVGGGDEGWGVGMI